eukprot:scaffold952_cov172-Chaetoceros_neogracile.AAC.1
MYVATNIRHLHGPNIPTIVVKETEDSDGKALAKPVHFEVVWTDQSTGGSRDGQIYKAVAPHGYVALSDVATHGDNSSMKPGDVFPADKIDPKFRCVHKSLVERAKCGKLMWTDKGSGGKYDGAVWDISGFAGFKAGRGSGDKPDFQQYSLNHTTTTIMARETFIDNPAEEDKNCSMRNIITLLQNEEEEEELDVVLASTDSTAAGGAVHVDHADVAYLLQWLTDNARERWDDINSIDCQGQSALHIALWNSKPSLEVINALLGKLDKEAINAIDCRGFTALHLACINGASWEVINGLLGKLNETVINAIDKDGFTALHYACENGASLEVINAIVTHKHGKEQVSIKNVNGKLPFDIFPDGKEEINEYLKNLLKLHDLLEANDPNASSYPNGFLQSILNLSSEDRDEFEFMNHSYFRKGINAKIIQPFSLSILFLDVAVQGLVMAVFSFTINGVVKELPTTSMAGLIPCLLWLLFREIVQYLSATAKFYFGDAANFVDIIQIVLVIIVLLISFIGKGGIDEGLLVACIGVAWTRLIFVISNLHYSLALFVAALLQVIKVLIPFMLVVSMICAAVAHIFHALYPLLDESPCYTSNLEDQDCEWTSSLTQSYFHTFAMTLTGDWEFLTSNLGPLSYLAMIFAFTMGIILMNMVIAVISNKYTEVEAKSEVAFWESRLRYIVEVESMKSIDSMSGQMCCFGCGKDEDNAKVKKTSVRPARMSMNEFNWKNCVAWEQMGEKHYKFLHWHWDNDGDCPTFLKRMCCFLEMAKWSEIFSISKCFRLCFLGITDDSFKGHVTWCEHAMARVGLFGIVFVLCLYAVIMTPLGLLTGGYFWAREVKEYIFWGDMHEPKLSSDSKILKAEIDKLNEKNTKQIDELKEQIKEQNKELKEQNKEQMKQILDAVACKKS